MDINKCFFMEFFERELLKKYPDLYKGLLFKSKNGEDYDSIITDQIYMGFITGCTIDE